MRLLRIYSILAERTGKTPEELAALPHEEFARCLREYITGLETAEKEAVYMEILKPDSEDKRFESLDSIANMLEYLTDKNVSMEFRKVTGALQNKLASREQEIIFRPNMAAVLL